MPIRKLVELDKETWGWSEIDPVKLKRVASEFKDWLLTIDRNNDPFRFLEEDLPLVEAVLNKQLPLPYKGSKPHTYEWREDLLPQEYKKICAPFYNTIRGAHLEPPQIIEKDGKRYAWADFESPDEGDSASIPDHATPECHGGRPSETS